jgi:hypothetical protein
MAFNPNFSNPSLPDYNTRWDKVEITYSPGDPGSGANLSATDFFSVPLQLNTFATANPDTPSTTLTWRAPTATTFSRLADLSGGNTVAVARGSNGLKTQGYGQVVRIISPSTVANPSVYSSFAPYVDFVKSQELMTLIRGSHSASRSYSFKAVVDKRGNLVMTGTVTGVPVAETNITIASQDLLTKLVFPLAVTTVDWLASHVDFLATYGSPAYTQAGNLPLLQVVSVLSQTVGAIHRKPEFFGILEVVLSRTRRTTGGGARAEPATCRSPPRASAWQTTAVRPGC